MKRILFSIVYVALISAGCAKEGTSDKKVQAMEPSTSVKDTSHLPQIADSAKLSKDEVRELARSYDLIGHKWQVNPHLEFQEGDISYWTEQGLTKKQLGCEFESRQRALQDAETNGEKIRTQGDLSYKAGKFKTSICM